MCSGTCELCSGSCEVSIVCREQYRGNCVNCVLSVMSCEVGVVNCVVRVVNGGVGVLNCGVGVVNCAVHKDYHQQHFSNIPWVLGDCDDAQIDKGPRLLTISY